MGEPSSLDIPPLVCAWCVIGGLVAAIFARAINFFSCLPADFATRKWLTFRHLDNVATTVGEGRSILVRASQFKTPTGSCSTCSGRSPATCQHGGQHIR